MNNKKTNDQTNQLPKVISSSTIELFGIEVRVYVLDDGRRVVHADDTAKLLEQFNERSPQ